jgi:hypothetical protein
MIIESPQVFRLIQDSIDGLRKGGLIDQDIAVTGKTALLGGASQLDSIGFVTFISDFEERLSKEAGQDVYLVISDIQDLNINNPSLTAETLAQYVLSVVGKLPTK